MFLPASRAFLGDELPETPHADDVSVVAFVESAPRHVEADGTFEGGDCEAIGIIVNFCVPICA